MLAITSKVFFVRLQRIILILLGVTAISLWTANWSLAAPGVNWSIFFAEVNRQYGSSAVRNAQSWERMLQQAKAMPDEVDKLKYVNRFFDEFLRYRIDQKNYGVKDYWAPLAETLARGTGDCEDYAIAKYITLRLAGIEDRKLRLIYVKAQMGGPRSPIFEAHMVLGYYATPNAEPLILDSLVSLVQKASMRNDLKPVFSFNSQGLWAGLNVRSTSKPTARLSKWQKILEQTAREGISLQ
ncbi:transglutaminase-like cysteine peptidase [Thiomicrorhabdus indica]|uniref:transglutaminase-like cysteine peptidase n=1 Tax=Thiomicrorhabdus indica TaxID=2267253 RepID=UPI002AA83BB3|nr:transglutaminase-like cysteine peptidase [Thiomicrorhabdus indica]